MLNNRLRNYLLVGLISGAAGVAVYRWFSPHFNLERSGAIANTCQYPWINPLFCSALSGIHQRLDTNGLKRTLVEYLDGKQQAGVLGRASIYFRDLKRGPVVNIRAFDQYYAGSLLKVPIMVLYLKHAQLDPRLLTRRITVDHNIPPSQLSDPAKRVKPGESYTVRELIEKMIIYSDNGAKDALKRAAPELLSSDETVDNIFVEMDLLEENSEEGLLSLQQYATIFRILYNSQYLSSPMSNEALEILSRSAFDRGIAAGLPEGTLVANKYGIPTTNSKLPQLHDCGIVYHPATHYILCIFTEGRDYFELENIIVEVSRTVYAAINRTD